MTKRERDNALRQAEEHVRAMQKLVEVEAETLEAVRRGDLRKVQSAYSKPVLDPGRLLKDLDGVQQKLMQADEAGERVRAILKRID